MIDGQGLFDGLDDEADRTRELAEGRVRMDAARALARASDPDTSSAAARSIVPTMSTRRADVLRVFGAAGPCTHDRLVDAYEERMRRGDVIGQADSGIRSRLKELVPEYVVDSTERETLPSGRKAIVWKLTPAGREILS